MPKNNRHRQQQQRRRSSSSAAAAAAAAAAAISKEHGHASKGGRGQARQSHGKESPLTSK
jgi:hypothetical protein